MAIAGKAMAAPPPFWILPHGAVECGCRLPCVLRLGKLELSVPNFCAEHIHMPRGRCLKVKRHLCERSPDGDELCNRKNSLFCEVLRHTPQPRERVGVR
jgi:hypothetical protein